MVSKIKKDKGRNSGSQVDLKLIDFYKVVSTLHGADVGVEGGKDDGPFAPMLDNAPDDWVQEGIHFHLSHLRQCDLICLCYDIWFTFVSSVPSLMVCPYLTCEISDYLT